MNQRHPIVVRAIEDGDRDEVTAIITRHWGSSVMVTRGKQHEMNKLPGFVVLDEHGQLAALLTYEIVVDELEMVSLDSLEEGQGFGSLLLTHLQTFAAATGIKRIWFITTNDNVPAMRFYQRRGYTMKALYPGAVHEARRMKPQIPLIGHGGIPIEHELEFELLV
ncbi:ribosomal protein S18 acetylase RimI-like enzyme [Paenibacillus phyllosphaerae]|uniref:Ribosomal protein S18 acetylase RimI-like enzyme n=1 Tax=Paenibacillus phyllosphaerae TaxID=274593 RepID=A0A7W5FPT1_9BACL|nr:GNAT family N-acetyltransferase [Paenibacillus phyllosphaerae]MBB3112558.1 ribosomal protein S18 acetylase RimI-like enzyme [Paenibacillus phyllosphaerae]